MYLLGFRSQYQRTVNTSLEARYIFSIYTRVTELIKVSTTLKLVSNININNIKNRGKSWMQKLHFSEASSGLLLL